MLSFDSLDRGNVRMVQNVCHMNRTFKVAALLVAFAALGIAERTLERVAGAQTKAPSYQVDPFWPKLPKQWILGQVAGLDIDANDHVWIIQRPWSLNTDEVAKNPEAECCHEAPPVMEFDAAGNYIQGWGGEAPRYEWPKDEHALHIDYKGNVWISSAGGPRLRERTENQILKFTKSGKFLMQIGHRGQSKGSLDTNNFNNAADIYVYPKTNEVFVADGYVNRRVIVLDADTGKFKRMWGAYGKAPDDSVPRTRAYDPVPQQFNLVHGLVISRDGIVYVADRNNNRVQAFTLDGKFLKEAFVAKEIPMVGFGTANSVALSGDEDQRFLYVCEGHQQRIRVLDRQTLQEVPNSMFGHVGPYPGQFLGLHIITSDAKGNIYTGDGRDGRIQKFVFTGLAR